MENIQIIVNVDVDKAVGNILKLVAELKAMKQAAMDAAEAGSKLAESTAKTEAAATEAAKDIEHLQEETREAGEAAENAAEQFEEEAQQMEATADAAHEASEGIAEAKDSAVQAAPQVEALADSFRDAGEKATTAGKDAAGFGTAAEAGADKADKGNTRLGLGVGRMFIAYQAMHLIIDLYQQLVNKINEAIEAQDKLIDARLTSDQRLEQLIENLHITGPNAQAMARQMEQGITATVPVTPKAADDALKLAYSSGHDPKTKDGMAWATEIAQDMQRLSIDPETMAEILRTLKGRNLNTLDGLKTAMAQDQALYNTSTSTDPKAFAEGFVKSVLPELPKGVDPNYAGAIYSAMVAQSGSERQAARSTGQLFALASGENDETRQYMAEQAAGRGLTHPGQISDDEVASFMLSDPKASKEDQREIRQMQALTRREKELYVRSATRGMKLRPADIEARINALTNFNETDAINQLRQTDPNAAEQLGALADQRSSDQQDMQAQFNAARSNLQSQANAQAWDQIPVQQRVQFILQLVKGMTPQQLNQLQSQSGIPIAREDAATMAAASQSAINANLAAARRAKASDTDAANQRHAGDDVAQQQRAANSAAISSEGQVDAGGLELKKLQTAADAQYTIDANAGNLPALTTASMDHNDEFQAQLEQAIADFSSSPEYQNAPADIRKRFEEVRHFPRGPRNNPFGQGERTQALRKVAAELGEVMDEAEAAKKESQIRANAAAAPASPPSVSPTTPIGASASPSDHHWYSPPAPAGPQASAGDVHHHHVTNWNFGNAWFGPADSGELPGRLEGYS